MVIRALALCLSFSGLCAGLRALLNLDRFIAPFTAASSVIALLMLGGMLKILQITFWAVYALGFISLFYAYLIKKIKPDCALFALLLIFAALVVWRFYPMKLMHNDDVSHWGLVARHLLRYNAFPDAGATHVFFQSYPLGMACFVYYIGRTLGSGEGMYFIAYNLLPGLLFLPVFANIETDSKRMRRIAQSFAVMLFVVLFHYFRKLSGLQVDAHLAFFGIGAAACVARYRNDLNNALISALPGMIAVALTKNSGLFFASMTAAALVMVARRCRAGRKKSWLAAIAGLGAPVCAYLLWSLHIKLRFPAALETKHAVSLSAYADQLASKGKTIVGQIAGRLIRELLGMTIAQLTAAALMLAMGVILIAICRKQGRIRVVMSAYCVNIGIYFLWFILVFAMYVFSMPIDEALQAASFYRYNGTGLSYMLGLSAILTLNRLNAADESLLLRLAGWGCRAIVALVAACAALFYSGVNLPLEDFNRMFERPVGYSQFRQELIDAKEEYALADGRPYMVYFRDGSLLGYTAYYSCKYEFETPDIWMIQESLEEGVSPRYTVGSASEKYQTDDLAAYLEETIDRCDAVILMDENAGLEAYLAEFIAGTGRETPVLRAWA